GAGLFGGIVGELPTIFLAGKSSRVRELCKTLSCNGRRYVDARGGQAYYRNISHSSFLNSNTTTSRSASVWRFRFSEEPDAQHQRGGGEKCHCRRPRKDKLESPSSSSTAAH